MSRRLFGGWGWDLSDREFGMALALLGVIAPSLAAERTSRAKGTVPATAARSLSLLKSAMDAAGGA